MPLLSGRRYAGLDEIPEYADKLIEEYYKERT